MSKKNRDASLKLVNTTTVTNSPYTRDFLTSEKGGWIVKPFSYFDDTHYTVQTTSSEMIFAKPVEGVGEMFNELVIPGIYNMLGIETYKSGIIKVGEMIGIGTTSLGTRDLTKEDYSVVIDRCGEEVASYFAASCFVANHDWGKNKQGNFNYRVSETKNGDISNVFQIDFGHSLSGPHNSISKKSELLNYSLSFLSNSKAEKHMFFGVEACELHPAIVGETINRVERLDLANVQEIFDCATRNIIDIGIASEECCQELSYVNLKILKNRQRDLRDWLADFFRSKGFYQAEESLIQ